MAIAGGTGRDGTGHGHCATNTPPHIDTRIGTGTRSGSGGMFPACAASTGVGGYPLGFFRQ